MKTAEEVIQLIQELPEDERRKVKEFVSIRAGHDIHAVSRTEYIDEQKLFFDEYFTKS